MLLIHFFTLMLVLQGDSESDLRYRLMEKKNNEDIKERMNADPNFVPQGRYYYEV